MANRIRQPGIPPARTSHLKYLEMIRKTIDFVMATLGIHPRPGVWIRKEASRAPTFSMKYREKGIDFLFVLSVGWARPTSPGRFTTEPQIGAVPIEDGYYFVADCILDQIQEVGNYESGRSACWKMTVEAKRGSATPLRDTVPVRIDVERLLLGDFKEADRRAYAWVFNCLHDETQEGPSLRPTRS